MSPRLSVDALLLKKLRYKSAGADERSLGYATDSSVGPSYYCASSSVSFLAYHAIHVEIGAMSAQGSGEALVVSRHLSRPWSRIECL